MSDSKGFIHTIEAINKDTVQSNVSLQEQLDQLQIQLDEANAMQEKYMQAFEQNLFPVSILQERLQKISNQKTILEKKENELSIQLNSSDTKYIQPDIIRQLLEKYVYESSSRGKKKQLFQLLLSQISRKLIKRSFSQCG
ncbi:hypothetical protein [Metabacillus litoralis]|uniref:hypothetical protein n=1 Tax=Metabacillus litoralis TaxID=152268 RepID=UPI001F02412B|nr:hypothetical protein [Metabacillus litoralis]